MQDRWLSKLRCGTCPNALIIAYTNTHHFYLVLYHTLKRYLKFNFILLEMTLFLSFALYLKIKYTANLHMGQCHCCYYALYL
jgi:hypothetical protein